MQPDERFLNMPPTFWANVRTISQELRYTERRTRALKVYTAHEIREAYDRLGLNGDHLFDDDGRETPMGRALLEYFEFRADVLTTVAEPNLMDIDQAREVFEQLRAQLQPTRRMVMNKQKGEKAGPSPLTGLVNMILESIVGDDCDYDPQQLATVTRAGLPVRTMARRVDGAYPSAVNPIALWEIKEYYFTTTFGSRVADGVYETILDGLELQELRDLEGIDVRHYLMVDSYNTWWNMGKSYLCRMVDMLHMGLVDEVLFGYEVVTRLPEIVEELIELRRAGAGDDHPGFGNHSERR